MRVTALVEGLTRGVVVVVVVAPIERAAGTARTMANVPVSR
jgi:hypothetical protein